MRSLVQVKGYLCYLTFGCSYRSSLAWQRPEVCLVKEGEIDIVKGSSSGWCEEHNWVAHGCEEN